MSFGTGAKLLNSLILHKEFKALIDTDGLVYMLARGREDTEDGLPIASAIAKHVLGSLENGGVFEIDRGESLERFVEGIAKEEWGRLEFQVDEGDSVKRLDCLITTNDRIISIEATDLQRSIDKSIKSCAEKLNARKKQDFESTQITFTEEDYYRSIETEAVLTFASTFQNEHAAFNNKLNPKRWPTWLEVKSAIEHETSMHHSSLLIDILNAIYIEKIRSLPIHAAAVLIEEFAQEEQSEASYQDSEITVALFMPIKADMSALDLAWFELFFAHSTNMPISLCQFCGKTYRLDGRSARGRYAKVICGSDECKKKLRRQREQIERAENLELQRKRERERKRLFRLKKQFLKLIEECPPEALEAEAAAFAQSKGVNMDRVMGWYSKK